MSFDKLRRRITRPFCTRTLIFEHTRIRVRSFPPRFEYEYCESLQELTNRGGVVKLEKATYVVYDSIVFPFLHTTLSGKGVEHTRTEWGR